MYPEKQVMAFTNKISHHITSISKSKLLNLNVIKSNTINTKLTFYVAFSTNKMVLNKTNVFFTIYIKRFGKSSLTAL